MFHLALEKTLNLILSVLRFWTPFFFLCDHRVSRGPFPPRNPFSQDGLPPTTLGSGTASVFKVFFSTLLELILFSPLLECSHSAVRRFSGPICFFFFIPDPSFFSISRSWPLNLFSRASIHPIAGCIGSICFVNLSLRIPRCLYRLFVRPVFPFSYLSHTPSG